MDGMSRPSRECFAMSPRQDLGFVRRFEFVSTSGKIAVPKRTCGGTGHSTQISAPGSDSSTPNRLTKHRVTPHCSRLRCRRTASPPTSTMVVSNPSLPTVRQAQPQISDDCARALSCPHGGASFQPALFPHPPSRGFRFVAHVLDAPYRHRPRHRRQGLRRARRRHSHE